MPELICPACRKTYCIRGRFESADVDEGFARRFFPEDLDYFVAPPNVRLQRETFAACVNCGCTWGFVDPDALAYLLHQRGLQPGQVPKHKSRARHYFNWLMFLAVSALIALVLYNARSA